MATATRQSVSDGGPLLTPVLTKKYALRPRHVVVCALFGGFFLFLNHLPLWHTDLWGHVAYGKWILAHRALPTEDPFMPLAEGMRVIDSAWLSQVILGQLTTWAGPEWLSNLFALIVLLTYLILTRVFYLRAGRLSLSVLGVLLALVVGWSRLATVRPETFGVLCFALLLWLVVGEMARDQSSEKVMQRGTEPSAVFSWIVVPLLFVGWANLHGSFLFGLAILACCTAGRFIEVVWTTHSLRTVWHDRPLRRWLLLSELATAATLLNPYGMDLLIHCLRFHGNANLRDVMEWFPLVLNSPTGLAFSLSCMLFGIALRYSRRSFSPTEVLLWAVFGAAAVTGIRMIGWYAAVVVFVLSPHYRDIYDRFIERKWPLIRTKLRSLSPRVVHSSAPTSFRYTLVCLLLLWMSFAFSGWSRPILGRTARPRETLFSDSTPLGVSAFLRANPPAGQMFNPQWWGDWLVWDGPAGIEPFVTTNVHLAPRRVWQDYVRIANAQPGCDPPGPRLDGSIRRQTRSSAREKPPQVSQCRVREA
jgi:hypothetical protein